MIEVSITIEEKPDGSVAVNAKCPHEGGTTKEQQALFILQNFLRNPRPAPGVPKVKGTGADNN